jgi:hypothetical protein
LPLVAWKAIEDCGTGCLKGDWRLRPKWQQRKSK